jgi:4-carboxymuconolactone decarboxylase
MPRLKPLPPEEMDAEQRRIHDAIVSGPRGGIRGPFLAWLRSPVLADRAQHLGEFCRFNSSLEPRLSELAILCTARHWAAQFEWYAHEPMAQRGGLAQDIIDAIRVGERPSFTNSDEEAIYDFCDEMYRTKRVSQMTYDRAVAELSERGVVDLVGIIGYYALVSMTLNAFEMPLPDGVAPPLSE